MSTRSSPPPPTIRTHRLKIASAGRQPDSHALKVRARHRQAQYSNNDPSLPQPSPHLQASHAPDLEHRAQPALPSSLAHASSLLHTSSRLPTYNINRDSTWPMQEPVRTLALPSSGPHATSQPSFDATRSTSMQAFARATRFPPHPQSPVSGPLGSPSSYTMAQTLPVAITYGAVAHDRQPPRSASGTPPTLPHPLHAGRQLAPHGTPQLPEGVDRYSLRRPPHADQPSVDFALRNDPVLTHPQSPLDARRSWMWPLPATSPRPGSRASSTTDGDNSLSPWSAMRARPTNQGGRVFAQPSVAMSTVPVSPSPPPPPTNRGLSGPSALPYAAAAAPPLLPESHASDLPAVKVGRTHPGPTTPQSGGISVLGVPHGERQPAQAFPSLRAPARERVREMHDAPSPVHLPTPSTPALPNPVDATAQLHAPDIRTTKGDRAQCNACGGWVLLSNISVHANKRCRKLPKKEDTKHWTYVEESEDSQDENS